jgi:DNA topoisomerase-1
VATKLLIVESPGKVKKLSQILGSDWLVRASMGHIRELASDGADALGFDLDGNQVNCRFVARGTRGKETIQQLRAAAQQVQTVVLATDYDREGETIAWHIQQALKLKQPQRVVYTEITPTAVQQAIAHPRSLDLNLVNSGLCRTVLDKLVGFKGSPLLWQLQNGAKSMGRVQSATLHLVCQRERQIEAFVPQDYWIVYVDYAEGFRAYYRRHIRERASDRSSESAEPVDDTVITEPAAASSTGQATEQTSADSSTESERVTSEAEANRLVELAQQHPHQVLSVTGKLSTRTPPPPFVTSTLQQAAGSRLRFSPEQTMQVAQSLYEAGWITYMRTDSVALSPEFCQQVRQWLEAHDPANLPQQTTRHRQLKGAQAAHEAIRPTDVFQPSQALRPLLSADQFALYVLIWMRAVASQCQAARVRQTVILTQSGPLYWQAKGQVLEFAGYSKYWRNLSADVVLPALTQGHLLNLVQAAPEPKQTQPPSRYSEPKLVQVMERQGIGRPSTYAPTIATLKQRGYVDLIKGQIQPTGLGMEVDQFLQAALPDLLEAEFTAEMERVLDQIASGEQEWQRYLTSWNREYFGPALVKARAVIPQHLKVGSERAPDASAAQKSANPQPVSLSRTRCPQCQNYLGKIPSRKLKKKYFLKCGSGCEVVMFWSEQSRQWQLPRQKSDSTPSALSEYRCPVCQKPLEEYAYERAGQMKRLLRCSDAQARHQPDHKEVVYFQTAQGWWSPKFGDVSEGHKDKG